MKSARLKRLGLGTAAALALGTGAVVGLASPAAASNTGGINVTAGCQNQYGGSTIAFPLDTHNAYSWVCDYNGHFYQVNMWNACRVTYPWAQTWAPWVQDPNNAYSWRCTYY